jgi:PAS domain S-box-containing protein
MRQKRTTAQKMSHRRNKRRPPKRVRQTSAALLQDTRKAIRAPKRITTRPPHALRRSADHAQPVVPKNGAPIHLRRAPRTRHPKTDLEAAIQRFVDLYDFAPIAYVSFDRSGRIEEANLTATELFAEPRDLLIGRPFAFYVADLDLFFRHLLDCRTSQQRVETELQLKSRKGELVPAQLISAPITSTTRNGALLYQTAVINLRERKAAEKALRESEALMRATVEQATAGFARCDATGRITFANRILCRMLGYTKSELIGKSLAELTHPNDVKDNVRRFAQMIRNGRAYEIEKRYIRKDGSILWVDVSASAVRGPDGKTHSAVSVIVDITARKRAEAALRRSKQLLELRVRARTLALRRTNRQLENEIERRKGLEGEILTISDREQQRLGQELHDGLCQHLTGVAFMARSIALRLRQHRVVDAADIEKIAELVNTAAVDTRNLSRGLHRMDVDAASFITALRDLAKREIWRTPCRVDVHPSFRIEDDVGAAHLYRIAREAVINANKHGRAQQIVIRLEKSPKAMVLRVIDDGLGFPNQPNPAKGLGCHIMKYRAQLIGGNLEIDFPQKGGTRVSCYFPLDASRSGKSRNGDEPAKAIPKISSVPGAGDLTL